MWLSWIRLPVWRGTSGGRLRTMQVQLAFPMHSWESFSLTQKLKALPCSEPYRDRVMEIFYNGQSFLLEE